MLFGRASWRQWTLVATGIVVVTSMVSVADVARRDAVRSLRAQVLVERVRANTDEVAVLPYEVRARGRNGDTQLRLDPAVIARSAAAWTAMEAAIDELKTVDDDEEPAELAAGAAALNAAALKLLTSARTGDVGATLRVHRTTVGPALERFTGLAAEVAEEEATEASAGAAKAGRLLNGSLVAGLAMLLLLGWRLVRTGRNATLAEARRALERRSEQRIRALVESSSDVVTVVGRDLRIRWQAGSVHQMLGCAPAAIIGHPLTDMVHPDDADYVQDLLTTAAGRAGGVTFGARFRHSDGSWRHLEALGENRLDDPAVAGIVLSLRDVTSRKALEDELRHQAFHDALTGLANRALFEDRVSHALAGALRNGTSVAVLFVDLDDFKTVNDSLGHGRGDELLRLVAERIALAVRPTDTAARLGGDEFAVLLEDFEHEHEAERVGARLLEVLAPPMSIGGRDLRMSASVGIAQSDGSEQSDEILRNADTAMYAAKDGGKNNVRTFESGMHRRVLDRLNLTEQLQNALQDDQFELDYQPIVELDSGKIAGVEALVRWRHPERGRVSPAEFIGLAEETGLIVPLGLWVLETACAQTVAWHRAFPERDEFQLSVNVSTRQLQEPAFPSAVAEILLRTGLEPECLLLEITEGLMADEGDVLVSQLTQLKALGLSIAVDDFGTGYSALSRLQNFPVDVLKIDRSFVDGMENDEAKAMLVRGIVDLGASMNLGVVAEGIEEREQADQLRAMHSPLGQGFLFSRPVACAEIAALLETGVRYDSDAAAPTV
jgi:diguanylate cyclase (GGDEF)-like protein/PAS domain S-box-containing protein